MRLTLILCYGKYKPIKNFKMNKQNIVFCLYTQVKKKKIRKHKLKLLTTTSCRIY